MKYIWLYGYDASSTDVVISIQRLCYQHRFQEFTEPDSI